MYSNKNNINIFYDLVAKTQKPPPSVERAVDNYGIKLLSYTKQKLLKSIFIMRK